MTEMTRHPSRATRVTFFEDRAQITRHATLSLTRGTHLVEISGATPLLDDPSLTVSILDGDGAKILTSRVRRVTRTVQNATDARRDELERRQRDERSTLATNQRALERAGANIERVNSLAATLLAQLQRAHTSEQCEPEKWTDALGALEDKLSALHDARSSARDACDDGREELEHTARLLEQARAFTTELDTHVEVQLELEADAELTLSLRYITPCALWRPNHRATLTRSAEQDTLTIDSEATLWQRTGEVWEDIECSFSTARPTSAAKPPTLSDDELYARAKTDQERHTVQVEARDVSIASSDDDTRRQVHDMPGVDDGGQPLEFHATHTVSPPSNGQPFRVPLGSVTLDCEADVVAIPELSPVAHVRARATWSQPTPLLSGPVTLVRGTELAGVAPVEFVAAGGQLELGFGPDSNVRIRREVDTKDRAKTLMQKRKITRTVTLHLSNLSADHQQFVLTERVPVSELEQVSVTLLENAGSQPDRDGILHIPTTLAPHETREVKLSYQLELAGNVSFSF